MIPLTPRAALGLPPLPVYTIRTRRHPAAWSADPTPVRFRRNETRRRVAVWRRDWHPADDGQPTSMFAGYC